MNQVLFKRAAVIALCVLMVAALVGCAGQETPSSAATSAPAQQSASPDAQATDAPQQTQAQAHTLPLAEKREISIFGSFNAKYVGKIEDYADMPYYQWLGDLANVQFVFNTPSTEIYNEQFGLLIASRELPDVFAGMDPYPGSPVQAYTDGVVISINEYMDAGYTPNLSKFYEVFPQYAQMTRKSSGEYLDFPNITGADSSLNSNGLIVRKDLLDAAGLEIPTTIDEWDTALRAFKEQGVIPFSPRDNKWLNSNMPFISAWNMCYFEYNDNGTAKYGAVQPEFKEYLELMNKWYTDGLLDPDYLTSDTKVLTAKVSAGLVGSYVGAAGGNLKNPWYAIVEENPDSTIEYAGAPVPKLTEDQVSKIGPRYARYQQNYGWYISSQCENPQDVCLVLDYMYSEEANLAMTYGLEGENYVLEADGRINPYTTDENGNVVSLTESWGPFRGETPNAYVGGIIDLDAAKIYATDDPSIVVERPASANPSKVEIAQRHIDQVRRDALNLWVSFEAVNRMPDLIYSVEETQARTDVYGDLETYVYENVTKFIIGTRSLDEFDKFVEECYAFGLEDALAIAQARLEEYLNK